MIRIIALFSQMLFLVWRLELTFLRTDYQLSNTDLILYHIVMVISLILFAILNVQIMQSEAGDDIYLYYPAQLLRLGVFFGVSYQFMNKLLDLIASQHVSNAEYDTPKHARLIKKLSSHDLNSEDGKRDGDVNHQLLNELIESEMENSLFTEKNSKLISIITKLSFLACIDFFTLFLSVTFAEIYAILAEHEVKLWITFYKVYITTQPFSWLIFSLTVWFSFTFAEKQYLCLFGCCHRIFLKYVENTAKRRTIKRQVESLSPRLSPILENDKSKEKSVKSSELELECSVMDT